MHSKNNIYTYTGAIHIHTTLSDGTKDVCEIAKIAKKCGLDFIIITDHNNLDVQEGDYDGLTVIKGEEISPSETNHYLALNINRVISAKIGVENYIKEVTNQNGFGFLHSKTKSKKTIEYCLENSEEKRFLT